MNALIQHIILEGTNTQKLEVYGFDENTPRRDIMKKFKLWIIGNFTQYLKVKSADFHAEIVMKLIQSYYGENHITTGFRGCAKTSLAKLFVAFVLLNDRNKFRKYIKVNSKDGVNSDQFVTDIYNMIIHTMWLYGDPFVVGEKIKIEEKRGDFKTKFGQKVTASTVGTGHRGRLQEEKRPDWILWEDVEDSKSLESMAVTQTTIKNMAEAIKGLSTDGSHYGNANYISDQGAVQWLINKPSVHHLNIPLLTDHDDNNSSTWPEAFPSEKVVEIKADCENDPYGDFWGEYMGDPQRSENKFFDLDRVRKDIARSRPPITESAGVRYWGNYQPNHRYGMASDHSEGVGLDSNTMALFDFSKNELIASYHNNRISPDLSVHEFVRVGKEFGNCLYAPENNHVCGRTAISTLKALNYPNCFRQKDETKVGSKPSQKIGWCTNSTTKYPMFHEFRTDYNEGLINIYDVDVLKEMRAYSNNDLADRSAGLITRHFDLLMAVVIAWQMRKYAIVKSSNYSKLYQNYIDS